MLITEYLIEPERLAKDLITFVNNADIDEETDEPWTKTIKAALRVIVQGDDTEALLTDSEQGVSEFLLDFVAWNRQKSEGIILAAESEWIGVGRDSTSYPSEVAKDFWKLLCVKSPTKVMIFASNAKDYPPTPIFAEIKRAFELYRHHIPGELYVFIDFAPEPARRAFYLKVPVTVGVQVAFEPVEIDLHSA